MLLQPLAIVGLAIVATALIDGTRWLVVFVPLMALLVMWLAQAIHAHQRAVALGGAPGGELQVALFLPLVLTVLTTFWLVGGRHGSPSATVEAYMAAWKADRPDAAQPLFAGPYPEQTIADDWRAQKAAITAAIERARSSYGSASGLDPARPFDNLRVRELDDVEEGQAGFVFEIVRSERFQTTVLGIVPTAGQRTVIVKQVLRIMLSEHATPSTVPLVPLPSSAWQIDAMYGPDIPQARD